MTVPPVDRLRVEKCDRDAAGRISVSNFDEKLILAGKADNSIFVQAFAKHRHQAVLKQAERVEELEAALRPFAECAAWIAEVMPSMDADYHEVQLGDWPYSLSIGWFRAARKALQERSALDG